MKEIIIPAIMIVIILAIFFLIDRKGPSSEAEYVKSDFDNREYLVRNMENKEEAAYMLSIIRSRINKFRDHLNSVKDANPAYKEYIEQFDEKIKDFNLTENAPDGTYTSYTVNKGDEIALCLRSRKDGTLHDINLIMYVVLHELAHVACPEIDHTPLFKKIFIFFLIQAENIDIYKHMRYDINPREYCGVTISENLLR